MFGQVREDAAIDLYLVQTIPQAQRLFVIASGGCTALSLIGGGHWRVDALDINEAQTALVLLKKALFKNLDFEQARQACCNDARPYYSQIESLLTPETKNVFASRLDTLQYGLNNCGWVDRQMRPMRRLFFALVHGQSQTDALLSLKDPVEQEKFYHRKWCNWQWSAGMKLAFSRLFLTLAHGQAAVTLVPAGFSKIMEKRLIKALTGQPNATNPYLWQAFLGQYKEGEDCLPPYLELKQAETLLANLDKLNVICEDTINWLQKQADQSIDYFGLSNILELLPDTYAAALEAQIVRCARPGALICVRAIFPAKKSVFQFRDSDDFKFDQELSQEAEKKDRSMFCNFYQIYRRKQ